MTDQTKPLSWLWERNSFLTGMVSERVRTTALAGLAVAWLFAGGTSGDIDRLGTGPWGLLLAAGIFAASLAADILHYFLGGWEVRKKARGFERQGKVKDEQVTVTDDDLKVQYGFYYAKVWLLFVGYVVLVIVFLQAALC